MSGIFNPYMLGNDLYLMQEKAATVDPKFREDVLALVEYGAAYDEDEQAEELERQVEERTKEIKEEAAEEEKSLRLELAEDIDVALQKRLSEADFRMVKRITEAVFRRYGVGEPVPVKRPKKSLDKKTVKR